MLLSTFATMIATVDGRRRVGMLSLRGNTDGRRA